MAWVKDKSRRMGGNESNLFHSYTRFDQANCIDHPITRSGVEWSIQSHFTIHNLQFWRWQRLECQCGENSYKRRAEMSDLEGSNGKGNKKEDRYGDATNLCARNRKGWRCRARERFDRDRLEKVNWKRGINKVLYQISVLFWHKYDLHFRSLSKLIRNQKWKSLCLSKLIRNQKRKSFFLFRIDFRELCHNLPCLMVDGESKHTYTKA
jgi:hypothetical protein